MVAAVVLTGEVGKRELADVCRAHLADFKVPRQFFFVAEIPRTATGKTQRRQDVEAGRPLEVEALVGAVVELGRQLGVPVPPWKSWASSPGSSTSRCGKSRLVTVRTSTASHWPS